MTEKQTGKEYIISALKKLLNEPLFGQQLSYKKWKFESFLNSHIPVEYMRVHGCDYNKLLDMCLPVIMKISEKWYEGIEPEELSSVVQSEVQTLFEISN